MVITEKIRTALVNKADAENRLFVLKLTPGLNGDEVLGVRTPDIRRICREMSGEEKRQFIADLPHKYHEENNLHAYIISGMKDEDECLSAIEAFLPYITNWATCDSLSPAVFKKHKEKLICKICAWIRSDKVYTVRTGVGMLMKFFLDEAFLPEYNGLVAGIKSDEYYVNMMCAWYFATALAKQYESTVPYIRDRLLTPEVHKMTVRKACESFRVTDERKKYLRSL